jgi:hypothetical protein
MGRRFDIKLLNNFATENNFELIGEYEKVNSCNIISGKCKTEDCNNIFSKGFQKLYKNKSFYCIDCMKILTREKIISGNLIKHGYEYPFQSSEIQNKIKLTHLHKYGFTNPVKNIDIRNKIKETTLKKYGVEYYSQTTDCKNKIKEKCLIKFGYEHHLQNPEIMEKAMTSSYKSKNYIFPSGRIDKIQGFENYGLDFLLKNENLNENEIKIGCINVPTIWYNDNTGKKRRHYVDIFIPLQNRCIEIKSAWTVLKNKDTIYLKQNAAKELGYKYEIWVYDGKGNRVEKYL